MKRNGHLYALLKTLSLVLAVFSIVLFKEYPYPWCMILWLPITFGYYLYWNLDDWIEKEKK